MTDTITIKSSLKGDVIFKCMAHVFHRRVYTKPYYSLSG